MKPKKLKANPAKPVHPQINSNPHLPHGEGLRKMKPWAPITPQEHEDFLRRVKAGARGKRAISPAAPKDTSLQINCNPHLPHGRQLDKMNAEKPWEKKSPEDLAKFYRRMGATGNKPRRKKTNPS